MSHNSFGKYSKNGDIIWLTQYFWRPVAHEGKNSDSSQATVESVSSSGTYSLPGVFFCILAELVWAGEGMWGLETMLMLTWGEQLILIYGGQHRSAIPICEGHDFKALESSSRMCTQPHTEHIAKADGRLYPFTFKCVFCVLREWWCWLADVNR